MYAYSSYQSTMHMHTMHRVLQQAYYCSSRNTSQIEQAFRCPPELCHRTLTTLASIMHTSQYLLQGGRNKLPAGPSPRARLSPWTEAGIPPLLVHTRVLPYFYLHTRRAATCILYGFARKCLRASYVINTTIYQLVLLGSTQYSII